MSKAVAKKKVFETILAGVEQASADYEGMSGWNSLWYAPEYFLTASIAKQISSLGGCYLTLEDSVRDTMKIAGANGPGQPRKGLRKGGRFDIVLWWQQGTPRAVIEVKHALLSPNEVFEKDIIRIRDVLSASQRKQGDFQFGSLAFWTWVDEEETAQESADKRIKYNTKALQVAASNLVGDDFVVSLHRNVHEGSGGNWKWAAVLLVIEPK